MALARHFSTFNTERTERLSELCVEALPAAEDTEAPTTLGEISSGPISVQSYGFEAGA
jgi:hypothetical protein